MINQIKWHEDCYANRQAFIEEERARIIEAHRYLAKWENELAFYRSQIETARILGKDSFDRDRFLIERH